MRKRVWTPAWPAKMQRGPHWERTSPWCREQTTALAITTTPEGRRHSVLQRRLMAQKLLFRLCSILTTSQKFENDEHIVIFGFPFSTAQVWQMNGSAPHHVSWQIYRIHQFTCNMSWNLNLWGIYQEFEYKNIVSEWNFVCRDCKLLNTPKDSIIDFVYKYERFLNFCFTFCSVLLQLCVHLKVF